eukprot:TRINITY_DN5295_c0_g1_i1.p2 TRINITY_DN5295_c0_g1~~TRINITY_DN5295_c0_g1_i1.p2  ORF type:complete len:173 (+),score=58.94 TRINITY_DN5295_c0_g1_i1:122-640(+)
MGCCQSDTVSAPRPQSDFEYAKRLQEQENRRAGGGRAAASRPPMPQAPAAVATRPHLLGRAEQQSQDWGATGGKKLGSSAAGGSVGGAPDDVSKAELRRRALAAAEKRQETLPGISKEKAKELSEQQRREDLIGKLREHYARTKREPPLGLQLASLEQLKRYWNFVQAEADS